MQRCVSLQQNIVCNIFEISLHAYAAFGSWIGCVSGLFRIRIAEAAETLSYCKRWWKQ